MPICLARFATRLVQRQSVRARREANYRQRLWRREFHRLTPGRLLPAFLAEKFLARHRASRAYGGRDLCVFHYVGQNDYR